MGLAFELGILGYWGGAAILLQVSSDLESLRNTELSEEVLKKRAASFWLTNAMLWP